MSGLLKMIRPMNFRQFQNEFSRASPLDRKILSVRHPCFAYTNLHLMEETLNTQAEFLNSVLNSLDHPFSIIDAESRTLEFANKATGFDLSQVKLKCYEASHKRTEPCSSENHPCPLEIMKKTNRPVVVTHVHHDAEGEPRFYELHCHPIFNKAGRFVSMIEAAFDVTDKKVQEMDLRNAHLRLAETSKYESIAQIVAGIFHDLNNGVTPLIGSTGLIEMSVQKLAELMGSPDDIAKNFGKIKALIESIRSYNAMAVTGGQVCMERLAPLSAFSKSNISVQEFGVEEWMRRFGALSKGMWKAAHDQGKEVDFRVSGSPDVRVQGNPLLFMSVLTNLCKNAIQEFPQGNDNVIYVSWKREGNGSGPGKVAFRVGNNGPMIPDNMRKGLFKSWTDSTHGGQGLGLLNVKTILEGFGATISCTSVPGDTAFEITFQPAAGKAAKAEHSAQLSTHTKVLIIDDEKPITAVLSEFFGQMGLESSALHDPAKALELLEHEHFDVVLLDQSFGKGQMAGTQAAKKIKELKPGIRIVLMTGHGHMTLEGADMSHVDAMLSKPLTFDNLGRTINEVLSTPETKE